MIELIKIRSRFVLRNIELSKTLIVLSIIFIYSAAYFLLYKNEIYAIKKLLYKVNIDVVLIQHIYIFSILDFFLKLLFKKDVILRPDGIKTKPILKKTWSYFCIVYNLLNFWNLYHLFILIPFLSIYCKTITIVTIILLVYLMSLCNSLILLIMRKSDGIRIKVYASIGMIIYLLLLYYYSIHINESDEQRTIMNLGVFHTIGLFILYKICYEIKAYGENTRGIHAHSVLLFANPFKMESISIIRSKRLCQMFFITIILLLISVYRASRESNELYTFINFLYLSSPMIVIGQNLLGIEANFFCGLWTKPYPLYILLDNKYKFHILITIISSIFLIPLVFIKKVSVIQLFSMCIYIAGFVNILLFPVLFFVKRLDLKSSAFFNYQGFSSFSVIYGLFVYILGYSLYIYTLKSFNSWVSFIFISLLGIISFLLRHFMFQKIYSIFKIYRYSIMERFRIK